MRRIPQINQHDEKDCGAACLSMILETYGKKLPLAQVREAIKYFFLRISQQIWEQKSIAIRRSLLCGIAITVL